MTNYGKAKYLTIEDVEFRPLEDVPVPPTNLNILQYYWERYSIKAYSKQPLLVIKNKNKNDTHPLHMLPELCLMTGMPDELDERNRR